MLDNPIFWIGLCALLPAFYTAGRRVTRLLLDCLMADRVTVTVKRKDGRTKELTVYLKQQDDLTKLLDEVAEAAALERKMGRQNG